MAKRIAFRVSGKVQGVFYRASTAEEAQKLSITGFVQNNSDGTVSGEAQGDEAKVKEFAEFLRKGPRHADVKDVESSDIATKDGETSFRGG